jgi:HAMP domain-containing protein
MRRGFGSKKEQAAAMTKLRASKPVKKRTQPVSRVVDALAWGDLSHTFALAIPGQGPRRDELARKAAAFLIGAQRNDLRRNPVQVALGLSSTLTQSDRSGIDALVTASRIVAALRLDERTAVIRRLASDATSQNWTSSHRDGYKDYLWLAEVRSNQDQSFQDALVEHGETVTERYPRRMSRQEQARFRAGAEQAYQDLITAYGGQP